MVIEERISRLKNMLDVAVEQGVLIFKSGVQVSPQDIIEEQRVHEESNYVPEFIVKNMNGEIKEIWYGNADKSHYGFA
ncbi:MAG: hypothetical protein K5877_09885 [Lachnospiraceae bacterium]|nr:hypothetical protein [Lachnospiraceae bacterium]